MTDEKKGKKIIADEDWKEQARKEKENLAAKEREEKQKREQLTQHGPLPAGDFAGLVSVLATQTLLALGVLVPEGQENKEPDLALAKFHIDMLEALEDKTKNNLDEREEKVLAETLHQVRMLYVKIVKEKDN
jgi:hypothetical protein